MNTHIDALLKATTWPRLPHSSRPKKFPVFFASGKSVFDLKLLFYFKKLITRLSFKIFLYGNKITCSENFKAIDDPVCGESGFDRNTPRTLAFYVLLFELKLRHARVPGLLCLEASYPISLSNIGPFGSAEAVRKIDSILSYMGY